LRRRLRGRLHDVKGREMEVFVAMVDQLAYNGKLYI